MKALILAGGKGTRLKDISGEMPKSMVTVGNKPLIEHQVILLRKYGIHEIILLVNYLKDPIKEHFGDGSAFGVSITYYEEKFPLGTAGGIREIEELLQDDFLVLYGDVMINMDLRRFMAFHKNKNSDCTLVVHPNDHPYDSDLLETDDQGRITRFYPKPHDPSKNYPNLVNAGAYILTPSVIPFIEKGKASDFGREIFPGIFTRIKMFGYNTSEYLKDMGTPRRWEEVNTDYASGKIERSSYEHKQIAIFLDRDGVINEEISFISKPEDMVLYPYTADAIKKINQSDYKAIAVTNQSVIARNLCTLEELRNIHNKLETELGKTGAKLDALYFCPHHPDKGFPEERSEFKIDCQCRKPKPGMLLDAARDFNLDLKACFMIGDSERDILAGKNVGCISIGVRTGYGLKKTRSLPSFFFANLKEAVDFIINEPYYDVFRQASSSIINTPSIILVGGNARSGKSTLAGYLDLKFRQEGYSVKLISLDNWVIPEKERSKCSNVFERFQFPKPEKDIMNILDGKTVTLPQYNAHPERELPEISYHYNGEQIVIIEGVVALSIKMLMEKADFRIFVDIEDTLHRQRIEEYYKWRGKNKDEINQLYSQRLSDEYLLIKKERKLADLVVNTVS